MSLPSVVGTPGSNLSGGSRGASFTVPVDSGGVGNVVIMMVVPNNTGGTSISGGGLTWTKRNQSFGSFTDGHPHAYVEVFYATSVAAVNFTATVTLFQSGEIAQGVSFCVAGAGSLATPFDPNSSLPVLNQSPADGSGTQASSGPISTNNPNVLVFGISYDTGSTTPTAGGGWTNINTTRTTGGAYPYDLGVLYLTSAAALSGVTENFPYSNGDATWFFDAIYGPAVTNATGTITTALTKASLSANGWTTVKGAMTTALSQASQSVLASEKFTGAITTDLSKVSQSLAGSMTHESIGTITTKLPSLSQLLGGWTTVKGSMTTALQPTSQQATAKEIFTGTITTNLNAGGGIASGIVGTEIFIGTIVTKLNPAALALQGYTRIEGTINTRLGSATGQMVANVVQAQEIIQGPIIMALQPFKPLILGAQLGTPGIGPWYSYRYTNS